MYRIIFLPLIPMLCLTTPLTAQDTHTSGVIISDSDTTNADLFVTDRTVLDGQTCIGNSCSVAETFGDYVLKLKEGRISVLFDDTTGNPDFSSNDWQITVNEIAQFGLDKFSIEDITGGTTPFTIAGGAPDNALYVRGNGNLGVGTSLPAQELHITGDITPAFRIEQTGISPYIWDIRANGGLFFLSDVSEGTTPLLIESGGLNHSVSVKRDGKVGLGTNSPEGKLHTKGDGVQLAYFESGDGDAVQVRFRTDSENRRFLAVDNADNVKTQMQFRDNAILFLGETVAQEWLNVSAAGITTAGPTCNPGPCDATFDPDQFEVPSIEDHAEYMWENQHLWAVGPTKPGKAINLTEKTGGIIHELEVAHIYIEELHTRLEVQEALNANLSARLEALEAQ